MSQVGRTILNLVILAFMIGHIAGNVFDIHELKLLKAAPVFLLIVMILFKLPNKKNSNRNFLVIISLGLIFGMGGDIFLMFPGETPFMAGTGSFMIGHFFYIGAYFMGQKKRQMPASIKILAFLGSLIMEVCLALNIYALWDVVPNRPLFIFYAFVVSLILVLGLLRFPRTTNYSYWFIVLGGVLFNISDHVLGTVQFKKLDGKYWNVIIMGTYYIAQYCIAHGALYHALPNHSIGPFFKQQPQKKQSLIETKSQ